MTTHDKSVCVLMVEDNPADSDLIAHFLRADQDARFNLTAVQTLHAGMERLLDQAFELVLLDLSLPDAQGLEAVLKMTAAWPDLPVVVLTGLDDRETAIASLQHGAQDYLSKDRIDGNILLRSLQYAIERKRIAVALQRSEQRYRALVSAMTSIDWLTDASGQFATEQSSWQTYTGQSWQQQRAAGWLDAVHDQDRGRVQQFWQAAVERRQECEFPVRVWHALSGRHRRCVARAVPIIPHGTEVLEWVGTLTDVEDAMRAEEALRRAERLASLGTLAAGIAHEINNPIVAAWTSAEVALHVKDNPDANEMLEECLQNVIQSVKRCRDTVENVQRFARQGEVERRPCDASQVISRAIQETKHYAEMHATTVDWHGEHDLPLVMGNDVQIQQVLVTLLRNAIEASEEEGDIELHSEQNGKMIRVSVVDHGQGMNEEEQQRAFDPFFTSRKEGGTGLGLSIAHGIIEGHGGSIEIDSQEHHGTTVTLTLATANDAEDGYE